MSLHRESKGTLMDYFEKESKMRRLVKVLSGINSGEYPVLVEGEIIKSITGNNNDIAFLNALIDDLLLLEDRTNNNNSISKLNKEGFAVIITGDGLESFIKTSKGLIAYN